MIRIESETRTRTCCGYICISDGGVCSVGANVGPHFEVEVATFRGL